MFLPVVVAVAFIAGPLPARGQSVPLSLSADEVLCRAARACTITLLVRLSAAPFPYASDPRRQEPKFFHGKDPGNGEPVRRIGRFAFAASRHYRDNRVLVHVPPRFDPKRPYRLLVFFHGHLATLRRDVIGRFALPAQVNASDRNVILIAPQLARDAIDSHPGRLVRQNGLRDLLSRIGEVLMPLAGVTSDSFGRVPVIIAGFSGGNVAVITSLERGGLRDRVAGVILLDALYGEMRRYAAWFAGNDQKAFLVALYGRSTEENTDTLKALFRERGLRFGLRWPSGALGYAKNFFVRVGTPHVEIPLNGPSDRPVADILRRLPPFEEFAAVVPGR